MEIKNIIQKERDKQRAYLSESEEEYNHSYIRGTVAAYDTVLELLNKASDGDLADVSERPKFVKCSVTGLISVNQSDSSIGGGFWEYLYADEVAKLGIDPKNTKNADMVEGGR